MAVRAREESGPRLSVASEMLRALLRIALGIDAELDGASFASGDWDGLESLLTRHGLTPVCCELLERHGVDVPAAILRRMQLRSEWAGARRRMIGEAIDDVATVLAAARVPAVLLRAAAMLRMLHAGAAQPMPAQVELLLADGDRPTAVRQLRAIGFRISDTDRDRVTFSRYSQPGISFVLTSRLLEPRRGLLREKDVRNRSRPADRLPGVLRIPWPVHELICLCLSVDRCSGSRTATPWRELYDLAIHLRQPAGRASWTDLVVEAKGRGLASAVAAALDRCEQLLSVAAPLEVRRALDSNLACPLPGSEWESEPTEPVRDRAVHVEWPPSYVSARTLLHPDRRPGLRFELGEDGVTISRPDGSPNAALNPSAAVILELCDGKHSVGDITGAAASLFEVAPERISADVRQALRELEARGLVRPEGAPIGEGSLEYPVVDRHRRWSDRPGNRFCRSRYVSWRRVRRPEEANAENDLLFFTQFDIDDAPRYRARRKVAWVREPPPIAWWTYDLLERHIDDLHAVLTYDREFMRRYPTKSVYCPAGGCHIDPDDFRLHPKTRLVSFIASAKRWRAPGHLARHEFHEMYGPGRRGFTELMLKGLNVDLYGPLVGNPIEDKLDSLREYMFQIAIENVILDTYFTEKLIDCFVTGTIPIYRGSRRVAEFFDAGGILFYSNTEELFEILRNLTPEEYERRLPHVRRNFALALRYTHAVDWAYEHTDLFRA